MASEEESAQFPISNIYTDNYDRIKHLLPNKLALEVDFLIENGIHKRFIEPSQAPKITLVGDDAVLLYIGCTRI